MQAPNLSEVMKKVDNRLNQRLPGRKEFNETVLCQLRAGHVPYSLPELSAVHTFLHDTNLDIASCDEAIVQLETTLKSLRVRKNNLQQEHDNAKALLSPVRRLSADVLEQLFTACIHEDACPWPKKNRGYALRVAGGTVSCTTMKLAQVSSFWRQVALSRPTLWSSICMETKLLVKHPRILDTLKAYILRSKKVPLRVHVATSEFRSEEQSAFDLLFAESRRWRSVTLDLWGPWIEHANRRLLAGSDSASGQTSPVPLLEYLGMDGTEFGDRINWSLFTSCPMLRTFEIYSPIHYLEFASIDLSKVRSLNAMGFGGPLGRFFARMPLLESCCLDALWLEVSEHHDANLIGNNGYYRTNLTTLDITTECLESGTWWTLRLPHLTKLRIRRRSTGARLFPFNLMDFSSVLVQSGCALQEVSLAELPAGLTVDFLASHQSITSLDLSLHDSDVIKGSYNGLLSRLTAMIAEPSPAFMIIPSLQSLAISITCGEELLVDTEQDLQGWGELACSMVELRCASAGPKLERFKLSTWDDEVKQLIRSRLLPLGVLDM